MKKFTFLFGMTIGFILGSRSGRGPYEQIEGAVRQAMNQPKVQDTLRSATDGAESVRDATLNATKTAIGGVSDATTRTMDKASKRVRSGTHEAASKIGNGA